MFKKTIAGLLIAAALGAAFNARPAPITIDFESTPPQYFFTNFIIQGMRFSPPCPVFIYTDTLGGNGTYLAVDRMNNCGRPPNPGYLGSSTKFADVWIDAESKPFSLLGIDSKIPFYSQMPFVIESSKGGVFNSTIAVGSFTLTGEQWTDIAWFTLHALNDGLGFHNKHGWDNLRVDIPEPAPPPPVATPAPPPPVATPTPPPPVATPAPPPPTNSAVAPVRGGGGGALPAWLLAVLGAFAVRGLRR